MITKVSYLPHEATISIPTPHQINKNSQIDLVELSS
jgi:hypothetical protein